MKVTEKQETTEILHHLSIQIIDPEGVVSMQEISVMTEELVTVRDGERILGHVPCTPEHLPELVAGWLLTEGHLEDIGDAEELYIVDEPIEGNPCETIPKKREMLQAIVRMKQGGNAKNKGNRSAVTTRERPAEAEIGNRRMAFAKECEQSGWDWLHQLKEGFDRERPLREITKASHSCMLVEMQAGDRWRVLFQSEDAGRHSAMDKAIGWGLLHGVDLSTCLLFTSGRISAAMAGKAVRAGVLALATAKPLVSTGAVQMARANRLLLVGKNDEGIIRCFSPHIDLQEELPAKREKEQGRSKE